jgi:molybdopterin-guanine dinucleotide biosynthesis protein A
LGILAGGEGRRWRGRDKGLIAFNGKPLLAEVCAATLATERLVCCRNNPRFYQHYADRVLCEVAKDLGPCAGITALLCAAATPDIIILPVDLIGAPLQVIETLETQWQQDDLAIVLTDSSGRHSPCLRLSTQLLDDCARFVDGGGVKLKALLTLLSARSVSVPDEWLANANTPEALGA